MRRIYLLAIAYIISCAINGCKKESNAPSANTAAGITVTTSAPSNETATTASGGGTITNTGSVQILSRGVCWKIFGVPTIEDAKTVDGSGSGTFSSTLTNLQPNTLYTIRAYATTNTETIYGSTQNVLTTYQQSIPTLALTTLTSSSSTNAYMYADNMDTGHATITAKGFCWSTSPNPTIANSTLPEGSGYQFGYFSGSTYALTVNTTYYFRAYATNSEGTGYSNEISLTTTYHLGEGLGGGRIFYIDGSGLHGLIGALNDQNNGARWNNTTNPFSWINAYDQNNGSENTTNIIAALGNTGSAASIARSYTGGGYTDWYLPSVNELYALELQQAIFGNFISSYYWSSTASNTDNSTAYVINFGGGNYAERFKSEQFLVRAIRAF